MSPSGIRVDTLQMDGRLKKLLLCVSFSLFWYLFLLFYAIFFFYYLMFRCSSVIPPTETEICFSLWKGLTLLTHTSLTRSRYCKTISLNSLSAWFLLFILSQKVGHIRSAQLSGLQTIIRECKSTILIQSDIKNRRQLRNGKYTHQSSGSQSLNPFANGLLAIFNCVICKKRKSIQCHVYFIIAFKFK